MRYLKCNLQPERHEEVLGKFWDYPTQEEEDAVHDLFTPHVFFETYGKRREALGNSIALPFWRWMFGRMAAYLPEGATLGSLFDGIGGFPLCWEDVHGAGTAVWASEIEEFPIAVTKKRFGGVKT